MNAVAGDIVGLRGLGLPVTLHKGWTDEREPVTVRGRSYRLIGAAL